MWSHRRRLPARRIAIPACILFVPLGHARLFLSSKGEDGRPVKISAHPKRRLVA
jgi:hypothetical protein